MVGCSAVSLRDAGSLNPPWDIDFCSDECFCTKAYVLLTFWVCSCAAFKVRTTLIPFPFHQIHTFVLLCTYLQTNRWARAPWWLINNSHHHIYPHSGLSNSSHRSDVLAALFIRTGRDVFLGFLSLLETFLPRL